MIYKKIIRPILFTIDPEKIHDWAILAGRIISYSDTTTAITKLFVNYENKGLNQTIHNIKFKNPVGLAAGFDKDVNLMKLMPCLSFGHEEIGSITAQSCEGNPKPRLWRLPKQKSIVVYYGLKNPGAQEVAKKLYGKKFKLPIGISIAKTNCKETANTEEGIDDYYQTFKLLEPYGTYFTINISCPNAYGGLPFTDSKLLNKLLDKLDEIETDKPVLLKLTPDLEEKDIDQVIKVAKKHNVQGFVISNLTKQRDTIPDEDLKKVGPGGLSGKPVKKKANDMISYVYKKTKGKYLIIGVGGIFSAEDAYEMIKNGASLVQLITGMIYEGPFLIRKINKELVKLLQNDGFENVSEAVGVNHKKKLF
ncbi:MAG: quinone-dependent dihydroorotate dehydrogenase [archaeon]|nr:quinone-dependent dihydroorotate dehydrogenase [Nanoarchaeota archaeon]